MKPYYEQDGITIYCGDVLDVLAGGVPSLAAIVMDPPYSTGTRETNKATHGSMVRTERFARAIENDQMTTPGFIWFMREVMQASLPSLVDGGSVLSFIDWRQWPTLVGALESCNLRVHNMVVWDKTSFGMGAGFRLQHELIMHASKGQPTIASHAVGNVIAVPRDANDDHPSPKPVGLIERLLEAVTEPGDLILDPFMGAGPTLRAAKNLGRRAIGIEINEDYCRIAVERLRQGVLL